MDEMVLKGGVRLKKWHWIIIICLSIVIAISCFLWVSFHGTPWGKWQSEKKIVSYLKEEYPGQTFEVTRMFYNFKFGNYEGEVIEKGKDIPPFRVSATSKEIVYDEYKYEHAMDKELVQKFSKEASDMLSAALQSQVADIENISVDIYLKKDAYPKNTSYQKDTKEKISIEIMFHNRGKAFMKQDFLEESYKALSILKNEGFRLENVSFYSYKEFQGDGYSIYLKENELDLPKEKWNNHKTLQDYKKINGIK